MKRQDFFYELPEELIAQVPTQRRDGSRLLCVDRETARLEDTTFANLPHAIRRAFGLTPEQKCLMILNNSKVYPARIRVMRASGGRGEVFLLETGDKSSYRCLLRPQKKLKDGEILYSDSPIHETTPLFKVKTPQTNPQVEPITAKLAQIQKRFGEMPLPPYIKRSPRLTMGKLQLDKERYQTVYSSEKQEGSAAAPTAGLHFTEDLMEGCKNNGIAFANVTLHVGLGTFLPVQTENVNDHVMHSEVYNMPRDTLLAIKKAIQDRSAIVMVGTTAMRAVESFFRDTFPGQSGEEVPHSLLLPENEEQLLRRCDDWHSTRLFIKPESKHAKPVDLKVGHGLLTNFHQPESTLTMLVSALLGYDLWKTSYAHAINQRYRFFSYGDSNLIVLRKPRP